MTEYTRDGAPAVRAVQGFVWRLSAGVKGVGGANDTNDGAEADAAAEATLGISAHRRVASIPIMPSADEFDT